MQIMKRNISFRHTWNLSRGRHSPGKNPSWHLPSPSLLPPGKLKPPSNFSALDGFELFPSSWKTSLSSGDKNRKLLFVGKFDSTLCILGTSSAIWKMSSMSPLKIVKKLLKIALFRLGRKMMSGSSSSISARKRGSGDFFSSV